MTETDSILTPLDGSKPLPKGRLADRVACGIALLSALLAFITATIFFLGFASNDTNPAGLASAFILSYGLGLFVIIPSLITAKIAQKAWLKKLRTRDGMLVLLLSVPWVVLSILILMNTPLPAYIGLSSLTLSSLICVWTLISLSLIMKNKRS